MEKRVNGLLREDLESWKRYLGRNLNLELAFVPVPWSDWSEFFLRRNLWVHNDGKVDAAYQRKFQHAFPNKPQPVLGEVLQVEDDYLEGAIDAVACTGAALVDSLWRKWSPGDPDVRTAFFNEFTYENVKSGRWFVVEHLCSYALGQPFETESDRITAQMNYWLALKRQGRWPEIEKALGAFDVWACHSRFAIAALCLRDDIDGCIKRVAAAVADGLDKRDLETWCDRQPKS